MVLDHTNRIDTRQRNRDPSLALRMTKRVRRPRCDPYADCCSINQLVAKRVTSRAFARFNFSLMCARWDSMVLMLKLSCSAIWRSAGIRPPSWRAAARTCSSMSRRKSWSTNAGVAPVRTDGPLQTIAPQCNQWRPIGLAGRQYRRYPTNHNQFRVVTHA